MSIDDVLDRVDTTEDDRIRRWFVIQGYWCVHKLPTGEWVGGYEFLFTWGICVGLSLRLPAYRTRFCYPKREFTRDQVCDFIRQWDGEGFPPGMWLKEKGERERHHPDRPEVKWDR